MLPNLSSELTSFLLELRQLEISDKVSIDNVLHILKVQKKPIQNVFIKSDRNKKYPLGKILERSYIEAFEAQKPEVTLDDFLLALASFIDSKIYQKLKTLLKENITHNPKQKYLSNIVKDITELEELGKLPKIIIREKETADLIQKLLQKRSGMPLLLGLSGVGKKSLVLGLAKKIVAWEVPRELIGTRILSVDIVLLANAPFSIRTELENSLSSIIEQKLISNEKIVLFFDNLHLLPPGVALGAAPRSGNKNVRIVGAAEDVDNFRLLENPLGTFWNVLNVIEPNQKDTLKIVKLKTASMKKDSNVIISEKITKDIISRDLKNIFPQEGSPGKILSILDQITALKKITDLPDTREKKINNQILKSKRQLEKVLKNRDMESVTKLKSQILRLEKPLLTRTDSSKISISLSDVDTFFNSQSTETTLENSGLLNLEKNLKNEIIGQEEALESLVSSVKRAALKLRGFVRPVGSFLFLGATGVGKTETAKVLSKHLFSDKENFIRIDMSDFRERHSVSRLVGAPPGYIGYEEGGQLTDFISENPRSVVLFDEVEKAHPDVLNILLQIMEEGELIGGSGETVSFRECIVILTGNIGSDKINKGALGFDSLDPQKLTTSRVLSEARKILKPEFLNRLDDVIVFRNLDKKDLYKICGRHIEGYKRILKSKGVTLKVSAEAKKFIVDKSFSRNFGARPLRRSIEKRIIDKVANILLKEKGKTIIHVDILSGKLVVK